MRCQNIWDEVAESYDKVSKISRAHDKKFNTVVGWVFGTGEGRVLDCGCGSGILEKKLLIKGFNGQIEALDFSKEMLKHAKGLVDDERVSFSHFDLNNNLSYGDEEFETVVSINVIFFLNNPKHFVKEIHRVLKKGGQLVLVTPKPEGDVMNFFLEHFREPRLSMVFKNIFQNLKHLGHVRKVIQVQGKLDDMNENNKIHYHDFEEIISLLNGVGFEIVHSADIQAKQNWIFVAKK